MVFLTGISVLAMWWSQPVLAQDAGRGAKPGAGVLAQRRLHRWNAFARWLQLSDEQKAKFQDILSNAREQARKIRTDSTLTPKQKRQQLQQLRQNTRQQIGSLLTPEQRKKMHKLWAWRWHRWQLWRAYRAGKWEKMLPRSPVQQRWLQVWPEMAKRRWWWNRWGRQF
jgi:Spy/CpxP family protein refolding chaperone